MLTKKPAFAEKTDMAQFSDEALKQLAVFIESESRSWAAQFIAGRQAFLRSRKITATGELIGSFASEIVTALEGQFKTELLIEFEEHGRFVDMKRLKPPQGGGDYIAALMDWIVKKGLERRFVQDFTLKRRLKKPPSDMLRQIAWSIAVKRTQLYLRRAWYAKSKSAAITDLYNRVASGLPDIIAEEIKNAFKTT